MGLAPIQSVRGRGDYKVESNSVSQEYEFPLSVRDRILEADGHTCRMCGATENLEVDHIRPTHHGGQSVLENGQTLCQQCHRRKTYYEAWIRQGYGGDVVGSLLPSRASTPVYYVATKIWNATKKQWEQYGPFPTYEAAWEWVQSRWLRPSR